MGKAEDRDNSPPYTQKPGPVHYNDHNHQTYYREAFYVSGPPAGPHPPYQYMQPQYQSQPQIIVVQQQQQTTQQATAIVTTRNDDDDCTAVGCCFTCCAALGAGLMGFVTMVVCCPFYACL